MRSTTISRVFQDLPEPRKKYPPRHPLINIITISICAVICGADNFAAIAAFGEAKKRWFEQFLDMSAGVPSRDTFTDVMNRLDSTAFAACFTQWITELATLKDDVIAFDGKVMRRALDKVKGGKATWLVNAWSVANNMCFAQVKVSDKSNEITAIPRLLELLDIEAATVTIDAMGCQTAIANQIVNQGGHYLLGLKGNQGEFYEDVKLFLDEQIDKQPDATRFKHHKETSGDHGRIETRTTWFTTDIDWLIERHPRWSSLKGIVVVESQRVTGEEVSIERRYYVTSHSDKGADYIGAAIRAHWCVENKLHWQLDVSFDEDSCRLRSGHAAANFSLLNKIALNLLKNEKSTKLGVKNKRLKAGWDESYMLKVLAVGLG